MGLADSRRIPRIRIHPKNPDLVYAAVLGHLFGPNEQRGVFRSRNGGQSWDVISQDLTRNDLSKMQKTGGLTTEDVSPTYASVLFAIAESPIERGLIWTGSNDGLVHLSRDGGDSWTNVTDNIPDLPEWGTISNIEPSRFDPATAYITVDFHQIGNNDPYVYKTEDYGASWRSLLLC